MQILTIAGNVGDVPLQSLLRADLKAGKLFWLNRPIEYFQGTQERSAEHTQRLWNARYAGTEAFTALDGAGYLMGRIFDKPYKAHRVIWAMANGSWPTNQIDHINGIRTDNRIENLRDASQSENNRNQWRRSDNSSGQVGVCFDRSRGKWLAYADGRHIGRFSTIDAAIAARKENSTHFSERHGKCRF